MRIKLLFLICLLVPQLVFGGMIIQKFSADSGGSSTLTAYLEGTESDGDSLSTGSGTVSLTDVTHGNNCDSSDSDGAFVLDANDEIIQIQTSGNIDYSAGRLEFNLTFIGNQTDHQYGGFICDAASRYTFSLTHEADDRVRFRTTSGSVYFTADTTTALFVDNTCHAIVFTWDFAADTCTLSIDGDAATIVGTLDYAPPTESANLIIGATNGGFVYDGRFDSISIYLTASGE